METGKKKKEICKNIDIKETNKGNARERTELGHRNTYINIYIYTGSFKTDRRCMAA